MNASVKVEKSDLFIDWLNFIWRIPDNYKSGSVIAKFFEVYPELKKLVYDIDIDVIDSGVRHWEKAIKCAMEIIIAFDSESSSQMKGVCVYVPSSALEYFFQIFEVTNTKDLLKKIIYRGGEITRLDLCFDDYKKTFMPIKFFEWSGLTEGSEDYFQSGLRQRSFISGSDGGSTFYLGRRSGNKYLRIYDKTIESGEVIDAVRYEFELHGVESRKVSNQILNGSINSNYLFNLFFRIIDPSTVHGESNRNKATTLPEWAAFLAEHEFCEEIKVLPFDHSKQKKSIDWFYKQCLSTAAMIFHLTGLGLLSDIAKKWEEIPERDRRLKVLEDQIRINLYKS